MSAATPKAQLFTPPPSPPALPALYSNSTAFDTTPPPSNNAANASAVAAAIAAAAAATASNGVHHTRNGSTDSSGSNSGGWQPTSPLLNLAASATSSTAAGAAGSGIAIAAAAQSTSPTDLDGGSTRTGGGVSRAEYDARSAQRRQQQQHGGSGGGRVLLSTDDRRTAELPASATAKSQAVLDAEIRRIERRYAAAEDRQLSTGSSRFPPPPDDSDGDDSAADDDDTLSTDSSGDDKRRSTRHTATATSAVRSDMKQSAAAADANPRAAFTFSGAAATLGAAAAKSNRGAGAATNSIAARPPPSPHQRTVQPARAYGIQQPPSQPPVALARQRVPPPAASSSSSAAASDQQYRSHLHAATQKAARTFRICIVSDFYYPRLGGVELHQYQLAQGLIRRGHKVILVTGTYEADASGTDPNAAVFNANPQPIPIPPPTPPPTTAVTVTDSKSAAAESSASAVSALPVPEKQRVLRPRTPPVSATAKLPPPTLIPATSSAADLKDVKSLPSASASPSPTSPSPMSGGGKPKEAAASGEKPEKVKAKGHPCARQGIRYMTNGLKVYYCPQMSIDSQASLPTLFTFFPLFRQILIRERIQIVHGHQTTSALAHECILHARTMGYKVVFTDHSLFGFSNAAAIHLNKLMKFTLSDIDHVICVSHTSKENLVLRAYLDPQQVSVIPNAVDTTKFTPNPNAAPHPSQRFNIVILSRLVYRKGIDLVVDVIPEICKRFPNVYFIIGGDGPKRLLIDEMREKHQLHDRVEMLGAVPHNEVRNVLVRGHLFLNCSLTEAFCIAILEAVSCGLFVVSTKVGGVPEILPENMIRFANPVPADIIEILSDAIPMAKNCKPHELHNAVKEMYNWYDVAERTERVYARIVDSPRLGLFERLKKYNECGPWAGKLFCGVVACDYLLWRALEWWTPPNQIDMAYDFPLKTYKLLSD